MSIPSPKLTLEVGIDLIRLLCFGNYREFCIELCAGFAWNKTSQGAIYWNAVHAYVLCCRLGHKPLGDRLRAEYIKELENEMSRIEIT